MSYKPLQYIRDAPVEAAEPLIKDASESVGATAVNDDGYIDPPADIPPLTLADLPTLARVLKGRLEVKEPDSVPFVQIGVTTVHGRAVYYVMLYGYESQTFESDVSLDDAVAKTRAWLDYDARAEANLAIGLAPDGSFLPETASC